MGPNCETCREYENLLTYLRENDAHAGLIQFVQGQYDIHVRAND